MQVSTKELYIKEMKEQGYSSEKIDYFHLKMIPYLLQKNGVPIGGKVVEVGAAEGHCSISAFRAGYKNLSAVDYTDLNFKFFKNNYGMECYCVDIVKEKLPFNENSVDAFIFFHTIEHISDATLVLSEMLRSLKPGGKCFIATPDWRRQVKTFYADPTHIKPYDKESLARVMRIVGWKNLEINNFGSSFGLGRLKAYKYLPKLAFIGADLLVVGTKESNPMS